MKTRDEKILEAVNRMEVLQLDRPCIKAFKKGDVWMLESYGALYEISNETELLEQIKKFEEKHKAVVYHIIHNVFEFGECYSFLFVSDYEDEWEQENKDLEQGYASSYVWNKTNEIFSEFGTVGVRSSFGGIVRVA